MPLPLTVLQILAIDLGTETLPALALGREPAEPGAMSRPPRLRTAGVVDRTLLIRAWLLLGSVSAVLVMGGFFYTLWRAGWQPGDPTGVGSPLHHAYLQATTVTFAGIVTCQIGTAFAARTDHASLFAVGVWSNPLLLWGIAFELVFTGAVIYAPPLQHIFGTAPLDVTHLALIARFPVIVWGADELARYATTTRRGSPHSPRPDREFSRASHRDGSHVKQRIIQQRRQRNEVDSDDQGYPGRCELAPAAPAQDGSAKAGSGDVERGVEAGHHGDIGQLRGDSVTLPGFLRPVCCRARSSLTA